MQTDLEEVKVEETTKLESSVKAKVSKFDETVVFFECRVELYKLKRHALLSKNSQVFY